MKKVCDILFQRFKNMPRIEHVFRFLTGKQANIFEQLPTSVIDTTCKNINCNTPH